MAMHDMTRGSIRGHLLRMSLFMLMSMVVQTLYSLIDLYWVGGLGQAAIAAVTVASNLMMVVLALSQILAVGTGALVAQTAGRKDHATVQSLFSQSLLFAGGISAAFTLMVFVLRVPYVRALASDQETAELSLQFLWPFIPALALQFPMMTLGAALRGVGDIRTTMLMTVGTVILNIVLAPVLIFGWGSGVPLGVMGAGLATLISISVGSIWLLVYLLRKGHHFPASSAAWRPQFTLWSRIAKIGLPSGVEFGLLAIYLMFIIWIIRPFGSEAQAAFGIGQRLLQSGMMIPMAVSFAASAVLGQNYGARQPQRVREVFRDALVACTLGAGLFFLLFEWAPHLLFAPFTRDPQVFAFGEGFMRYIAWNMLASGVIFACMSAFTGFGNTLPSLIGSLLRITLIVVPTLWLSQHPGFQIHWVWALSASAAGLQMCLNLWFLRREFRIRLRPLEAVTES